MTNYVPEKTDCDEFTLGDYIDFLKGVDPNKVFKVGLGDMHSWRGLYEELAVSPVENISAKEMLKEALSAVNKTFTGYKGGEFEMIRDTTLHIDYSGRCCESKLMMTWLLNLL